MPAWLGALGMQAAGNAVNAGMGMALGAYNDHRQLKQQKKLNDLENARAMEMWEKTNYKAQVEQLKKAGMNPGLLYGMGGAGGATMGHAAQNAPSGGAEMGMMKGAGAAELALMAAQTENIKADTANKKQDTTVKETTVPKIKAETASITQGITNQQTQNALMEIQDSLLRNELWEKYESQDDRMQAYANQAKEGIERAEQAMIQTGVDRATMDDKIKQLKATAVGEVLKNILTEATTGKAKADTALAEQHVKESQQRADQMAEQIIQEWARIAQSDKKVQIEGLTAMVTQMYQHNKSFGVITQMHDPAAIAERIREILNQRKLRDPVKSKYK